MAEQADARAQPAGRRTAEGAAASPPVSVSAAGLPQRDLRFSHPATGERLVGTLTVREEPAAAAAAGDSAGAVEQGEPPRHRRCAILCHGMLAHRSAFFFPRLRDALLLHCGGALDGVLAFDYGMRPAGESEGRFQYGGLPKLVEETQAAIQAMEERGWTVTHLIGHSMGANSVLLHAAAAAAAAAAAPNASAASSPLRTRVPHVVSISPRFDMSVDKRLSHADLLRLIRDGVVHLKWRGGQQVPVTLETMRDRLRTDMTCIRQIALVADAAQTSEGDAAVGAGAGVHTLLIHGDGDETIPVVDSHRAHHCMLTGQDPGSSEAAAAAGKELEPAVARSTCVLKGPLLSASSPALTVGSFQPALSPRLPHAFVPLPGANHCFTSEEACRTLLQTICLWVNEHAKADSAAEEARAAAAAAAASAPPADDDGSADRRGRGLGGHVHKL